MSTYVLSFKSRRILSQKRVKVVTLVVGLFSFSMYYDCIPAFLLLLEVRIIIMSLKALKQLKIIYNLRCEYVNY